MPIYLDHAATTPLRREVLDAMLPYLTETFGNPSSAHAFGRAARAGLDDAHERSAATARTRRRREIVFTSGGTEANNLALKGAAWAGKARGHRIVTTSVEHHAVGHTLRYLEKFGFEIVELPVDRYGRVDPDAARGGDHRPDDPRLGHARQQRGRDDPADRRDRRAASAARKGVLFHVDAVQAAPYVDLDVEALGVDLVALGAHKFEGPKGVGALYVRHGTHILAQQQGGTQERHRRAGTENVAGRRRDWRPRTTCRARSGPRPSTRLRRLRERLAKAVLAVDGVEPTGHPKERLPGHPVGHRPRHRRQRRSRCRSTSRGSPRSVGSACTTGSTEVSHVLTAMGYPEEEARGALRLSLGRTTTEDEIDEPRATVVPAGRRLDAASATRRRRRGPAGAGRARVSRILVAMSGGVDSLGRRGAPPRAGPRGRRRLDAPPRRRRHATPSSRRAAARSMPPTTRGASRPSSTSRSTS